MAVILLHDNAPSYTSKLVKETLKLLGWDILLRRPPRCNPLTWRHLTITSSHQWDTCLQSSTSAISKKLENGCCFAAKQKQFFWLGIHNLPERWSKCVEADSQSFE
jgi:hypothetical protein